ncbi:MAG: tRNA lysidine(34) synthetase TilS [Candidatus Omnitrophica bacterium]|nr:tRNA lysidine(34) synthetase TilS [Candidatus Omnitrophota bacterium]
MLIEKIDKIILREKLLNRDERLLVCVSGGPDSVFLLELLFLLKDKYKLDISVAHVNHCLRAKESDCDELFVRRLSRKHDLPFFRCRAVINQIAKKQKTSIEETARMLRYNFFFNLCSLHKFDKIVLAHTKDDQTETILMRILRGTGLSGLVAMQAKTCLNGFTVIRPLLAIEKKEIIAYLKKHRIKFRQDSSNLKTDFFRNKIRLKILPFLKKISPQIDVNLQRLAEQARQLDSFLDGEVKKNYSILVSEGYSGNFVFARDKFLLLMPAMRGLLLRHIILKLAGDLRNIDCKHIQIAEEFIADGACGSKSIDLPKGIIIKKTREYIYFQKGQKKGQTVPSPDKYKLPLGGGVIIPELGFSFKANITKKTCFAGKKPAYIEYFDCDELIFPLIVRTREFGDVFWPLGMPGKKKLKKFFIDEKIEGHEKGSIPLIVSGDNIAWVVGRRIAEFCKITGETKRILKIEAKPLNPKP